VIRVDGLTKRFGRSVAVDNLSFSAAPGRVTGFLGPNGSGKSTTMRCMIGLDRADAGQVTFDGSPYHDLSQPITHVGVLLDAGYVHPARRAVDHLRTVAVAGGVARSRVDDVLEMVGLVSVGRSRVRHYSLGMRQRLGLAAALLGDPAVVILDEPANGLDPEGIRWIRDMLRHLASHGRTVLVSSHQLGEISLMADDLVVIGRGRLIDECPVGEFIRRHTTTRVRVRSPHIGEIVRQVRARGADADIVGDLAFSDAAVITGLAIVDVGEIAAEFGAVLHELTEVTDSLEDAFLSVTGEAAEFRSGS
jgi:ABC-2 type transport system ATP-binding protein